MWFTVVAVFSLVCWVLISLVTARDCWCLMFCFSGWVVGCLLIVLWWISLFCVLFYDFSLCCSYLVGAVAACVWMLYAYCFGFLFVLVACL